MRQDILKKRYFFKDEEGNPVEDWEGLCRRVTAVCAKTSEQEKEFLEVMQDCLFLPNSPALMNAGREKFSLSACFVLPVKDSMEGIFESVKHTALIHKAGGGTGFSFSRLRPSGDIVGSTKGVASGPCSFIHVFDAATHVTRQGGVRRGANMGILRVDHPDVMEFINLKKDEGVLQNINLSIAVTDSFLKALKSNSDFPLVFKGKTRRIVKAKEIWDAIIEGAWRNGEPGVIFIDRINRDNPTPHIGEIESTNPCGEQPLLPYEACVLGSINLSKMVYQGSVDYEKLSDVVRIGVRFLDNILDIQSYPLPEVERMHKGNRKIGLGVMGWADMLIKLGLRYDSEEALQLAEKVMKRIESESIAESCRIAEAEGVFPNWEGSEWQKRGIRIRNATTTTIAPTGSLSIIAGCSSGIEPVFDFETLQKRADSEYRVLHPLYKQWKESGNGDRLPPYFLTAREVSVQWHIRMQAAFQRHVHNAVSKTINLSEKASKEDIQEAFLLAYELGCKGVTVYRDGSRRRQVISSAKKSSQPVGLTDGGLKAVLDAKRVCVDTSEGKVYINVSLSEDKKPIEVFIVTPVETKFGEIYESFGRIFSLALRNGLPVEKLLSQLEKANKKYGSVASVPSAIIRAFRMLDLGALRETCPDCGGVLVLEEGCIKCLSCGFTKC